MGGSVNGTDLHEADGEIGNGKRVRRLNDRNEKDYEIESGSYGYDDVRKYKTKQVPWVNECDDENVRGCIESTKERNDETVTANRGGTGNEMTVQRGGTSVKNVTEKLYGMVNEEVTANRGGTGINMTAKRVGTSMENVTEEGCGMVNENNMTAKRVGTSMKNVTEEGCGMVNENNVTANSGGTGTGMTAQWGSGIDLNNENMMTVQRGDVIGVNNLTA